MHKEFKNVEVNYEADALVEIENKKYKIHGCIAGEDILVETEDGKIQPLPVNDGAYAALEEGSNSKYYGYLVATIPASKPFAAIMTRGTINPKAAPYTMSAELIAAVKAALPLIDYQED